MRIIAEIAQLSKWPYMAMFTLLLLRLYDLMYEVRPLVDWLSPQSCRLIVMSSIKKFLTVKHTNGLSLVDKIWGVVLKELIDLSDCLISPWGQSWERVLHKHKCIQITARVPKAQVLWLKWQWEVVKKILCFTKTHCWDIKSYSFDYFQQASSQKEAITPSSNGFGSL
jgi:hypothetical protein